MNVEATKSAPRNAVLSTLCERFTVFRECQPLALGVHKRIRELLPEIEAPQLRAALRTHTASTKYLKALVANRQRFDLDAQAAGEVTDEQRAVAETQLRERFAKQAERKKAEASARKESEVLVQRQEKLSQLAARFSKR